jgi:hypothetical protein
MKIIRFLTEDHGKKVANLCFLGKIVPELPINPIADEAGKTVGFHHLYQRAEGNDFDQQLGFIFLPVMERHPVSIFSGPLCLLGQIRELQHGSLHGVAFIGDFQDDRFIAENR